MDKEEHPTKILLSLLILGSMNFLGCTLLGRNINTGQLSTYVLSGTAVASAMLLKTNLDTLQLPLT